MVRPVTGEQLVSPSVRVKCLDLATMAPQDQDFTAEFRLEAHAGAGKDCAAANICLFDCLLLNSITGLAGFLRSEAGDEP